MSTYHGNTSNAALIRDLLASTNGAMSIDEITAALSGKATKAQVKDATFQMCKATGQHGPWIVKCGTRGRQLFKLAAKPKPRVFNVTISPSVSLPATKPPTRVETIEEWERNGGVVERLPIGASAHPLARIGR